jgi:type III restriction enzyme
MACEVKKGFLRRANERPMSLRELRKIEEAKIECARKFFAEVTSDQVRYDVGNSCGKLIR